MRPTVDAQPGAIVSIDGRPALRFERRMHHPIERVWRALTDPDELAHWFPQVIEGEVRAGASLRFVDASMPDEPFTGRVTIFRPPRLLAMTWGEDELRFELEPVGDATRFTLIHRFDDASTAARDGAGWHAHVDVLLLWLGGDTPSWTPIERWRELHPAYVEALGRRLPAVEAVVIEAQMPPGVLGPSPETLEVRCFLVRAASGIVLVDVGLPGTSIAIETALGRVGGRWSDVTDIVLTHAHFDHVGGLAEAASRSPDAKLWAGALDVASVPMDGAIEVRPLVEGDRVGVLEVLDTPGHTPGHISLLLESGSLVLVGDLLGSVNGALSFGPPAFTADQVRSRASLERVLTLGVDRLLFSHGAEVAGSSDLARDLLGRR